MGHRAAEGWARVKGVEGKIKGGVHTLRLTPCLHIVLGVHYTQASVHTDIKYPPVLWGF